MDSNEQIITELVERARIAQKVAEGFSQEEVDKLAAALVYKFSRPELAKEIAKMAVEETSIGNVPSKISKFTIKMPAVFYDVKFTKTVGVIETIPEKGITKIAKPIGVIAALVPSTNPEATQLFQGVLSLRARNAIIFAPHPKSKKTTNYVIELMRELLKKNGVPEDLFICIKNPSKELSQELMRQCDLTMATGGAVMVKAAYSSGKPAYGVGAGNAAIVVDETADIQDAAAKIRIGKTGDNASGCSAENSLVVQKGIYKQMIKALQKEGGYLATELEKQKLQNVMWVDGHISKNIVAKPVLEIARLAKIEIPKDTAFIMVEETGIGNGFPFSGEKLSLVLTVYKYDTFDDAVAKVKDITGFMGSGHSCGIHSFNREHVMQLALNTYTVRVIVRQPHGAGNSGNWFNGLANTFQLGCGTWGGNIASENITQKHYMNITWVAEPIDRNRATDDEIYGDLLKNIIF